MWKWNPMSRDPLFRCHPKLCIGASLLCYSLSRSAGLLWNSLLVLVCVKWQFLSLSAQYCHCGGAECEQNHAGDTRSKSAALSPVSCVTIAANVYTLANCINWIYPFTFLTIVLLCANEDFCHSGDLTTAESCTTSCRCCFLLILPYYFCLVGVTRE